MKRRVILAPAIIASNCAGGAYEFVGSLLAMDDARNVRLYEVCGTGGRIEYQLFILIHTAAQDLPQWMKMFSTQDRERAFMDSRIWSDHLVLED